MVNPPSDCQAELHARTIAMVDRDQSPHPRDDTTTVAHLVELQIRSGAIIE
jgi:hypothetical protein